MTRPSRFFTGLGCVLSLAAGRALRAQEPPRPYLMHWAGASGNPAPGQTWRDWDSMVDFSGTPIHRDMQVFYEWNAGNFPAAGLHVAVADPTYMNRHLARLDETVTAQIPDPNWDGYAVIDYETWAFAWAFLINVPSNQGPNALDHDFKDDWRDYIRRDRPLLLAGKTPQQQEAVFESTFNAAAQEFILATLNECKRLRPHAKWGFYMYPITSYHDYQIPENADAYRAKDRANFQWLYDAQDVIYPCIYSLYYSVADRPPNYRNAEDSAEDNRAYIVANVQQAIAVAHGKPVIPFAWVRYHENCRPHANEFLNPVNLRNMLEVPKAAGADGIALWEAFHSDADLAAEQAYLSASVYNLILDVATDSPRLTSAGAPPATPPTPPSPGGGSGGDPGAGSGQGGATPGGAPQSPPTPPSPPPDPGVQGLSSGSPSTPPTPPPPAAPGAPDTGSAQGGTPPAPPPSPDPAGGSPGQGDPADPGAQTPRRKGIGITGANTRQAQPARQRSTSGSAPAPANPVARPSAGLPAAAPRPGTPARTAAQTSQAAAGRIAANRVYSTSDRVALLNELRRARTRGFGPGDPTTASGDTGTQSGN